MGLGARSDRFASLVVARRVGTACAAVGSLHGRRLALGEMSMKRMDEPRFGVAAANGSPPFSRIPEDRGSSAIDRTALGAYQ